MTKRTRKYLKNRYDKAISRGYKRAQRKWRQREINGYWAEDYP